MQKPEITNVPAPLAEPAMAPTQGARPALPARTKLFFALAVGLIAAFALPLWRLARFALHTELYSHILLVPAVCGYFVWEQRRRLSAHDTSGRRLAGGFALIGVVWLAVYGFARSSGGLNDQDTLCLWMLAFVFLLAAAFALAFGTRNVRVNTFPLAFLLFLAPLPLFIERTIEIWLQHASAETTFAMFNLAGTPMVRDGMVFQLPRLAPIEVATACSGIHSTLTLFLTGLVAGQFFLRNFWTKTALAVGAIALGIVRNAARIFFLSQMARHGHPNILDSWLHHDGGPVYFLISLIPLFLLIWWLRKLERRRTAAPS